MVSSWDNTDSISTGSYVQFGIVLQNCGLGSVKEKNGADNIGQFLPYEYVRMNVHFYFLLFISTALSIVLIVVTEVRESIVDRHNLLETAIERHLLTRRKILPSL